MTTHTIGIVIEGATGRLGTTQHLRSLLAIRGEGGLKLGNGDRLMPQPILLGCNPQKLAALATAHGGLRWSIERDAFLADPDVAIYFDATATGGRPQRAAAAIVTGKHIYLEKPIAGSLGEALDLARAAHRAGVKNGVVQDKLFLPGLRKMKKLYDSGFLGGCCQSGSILAGGCSMASFIRRSAQAGITKGQRVAVPSSICSRTGGTSSTGCSADPLGVMPLRDGKSDTARRGWVTY